MSEQSKIEWCDASWSPVVGCSKVSDGCLNCYAERMAYRLACIECAALERCLNGENVNKKVVYCPTIDVRTKKWAGKVVCREKELDKPLHWRKPRMIFVCSMGDLFHPSVPFEFIDKVVDVFNKCPQHTGQILTKRAERLLEYSKYRNLKWPENIIGMVTAENQPMADLRIPHLLRCGFETTGVSLEPMLEEIDLENVTMQLSECAVVRGTVLGSDGRYFTPGGAKGIGLDWVIIGCESLPGGKAGRFQDGFVKAARDVVQQCKAVGVPVFVKQLSINGKVSHNMSEWPEELRIREYPK